MGAACHLTLEISKLVWSWLTANVSLQVGWCCVEGFRKKWTGLGIPSHFRGCHPRGDVQASLGRDQLTDFLCVLLVGGFVGRHLSEIS